MRRYLYCALLALPIACAKDTHTEKPDDFTGSVEFATPVDDARFNSGFPVQLRTSPEASRIDLYLDDEGLVRLTWPYRYEFEPRQLTDGAHTLKAIAYFEEAGGTPHQLERSLRFTLDRQAPSVASRIPAPGQPFFRACGITVEFSEPIAPGSLSLEVRDASGSPLAVSPVLVGDRTVRFNPSTYATAPNTLSISVSAKDLAGNTSDKTTWTLQVPELQEKTLPETAGMAEMAIARNGSDVVLAYQSAGLGEPTAIALRSLCQDTPATVVERNAGALALATAPDGTAYAVHNGIHLHSLAQGDWGQPVLTLPYSTWLWETRLAIGANGTMAIGWLPQQESRCQHAGRVVAGVAEELPNLPCAPEGGFNSEPEAAVDGNGRPVFAWLEHLDTGEPRVHVVAWESGWRPLGAPMPTSSFKRPVLNVNLPGNPILAYTAPSQDGILVKVWGGTAWEDLPKLTASYGAFPRQLVSLQAGYLLVWERSRSDGNLEIVISALIGSDTTWTTVAGPFPVADVNPFGEVRLVADSAGWTLLAWTDPREEGRYSIRTVWNNAPLR